MLSSAIGDFASFSRLIGCLAVVAVLAVGVVGCDQATSPSSDVNEEESTAPTGVMANQESGAFYLEQGESCWQVEPLSYQNQSVEEYYGFNNAHAHPSTDILKSDVSHLFLFDGPQGRSLVPIHDIASHDDHGSKFDTGGGAVSFDSITGLPDDGRWVVQDDSWHDTFTQTEGHWSWAKRNTDGGAYRDLGANFDVSITPAFNEQAREEPLSPGEISFWCFLSGDAEDPNGVLLDMETDARLIHSSEAPCANPTTDLPSRCVTEPPLDIKPCSDPNAIQPDNRGVIPVAIQGTADFDPTSEVDVETLRFGALGHVEAKPAHDGHTEDTVPCEGDGIDDLVVHFPTEDTGFEDGDELGKLKGELHDGSAIVAFDEVKIVGGEGGAGNAGGNGAGNAGGNSGGHAGGNGAGNAGGNGNPPM